MTRTQLEHIIRAAATLTDTDALVVLGSQAILGQYPHPPPELTVSDEADIYPRDHPELADLIDGTIGELSPFHETFGYYAQGIAPETAILPRGWQDRLIALSNPNTRGATGWCLELHDLLLGKYVAGRAKDRRYIEAAIRHGLVQRDVLIERVAALPVEPDRQAGIAMQVQADLARFSPSSQSAG